MTWTPMPIQPAPVLVALVFLSAPGCADYAALLGDGGTDHAVDPDGRDGEDGDDPVTPRDGRCVHGIPEGHPVFADEAGGLHEPPSGCIDAYGFYRFETNCAAVPAPGFIHMSTHANCFVFFWLDTYLYEDSCTGTITDFNLLSLNCIPVGGTCNGVIDLEAPFSLRCSNSCTIEMEWMGAEVCLAQP